MTSLDDSIISRQNLMLLDNITNYSKPALDYFHHDFSKSGLEIPLTWSLMLKMRKHKLLRLPNCSPEDDRDYRMYAVRLHHCLWRRWSIEQFKLEGLKVDPLSINWDKEIDITVLYGPDLASSNPEEAGDERQRDNSQKINFFEDAKSSTPEYQDEDVFSKTYDYSSSIDSSASSIFDEHNICTKTISNTSSKSLKFNDTVLRRDIDKHGICYESKISINDTKKLVRKKRRQRRRSREHDDFISHSHTRSNSDDRSIYLLQDDDDDLLEHNIKSLNLNDDDYIYHSL